MGGRIIRQVEQNPLPPRLGKIKVGLKHPTKGYPMSVDYFVPSGKYASLFTQTFGEKPKTLLCYFPSDDPEQVCREEYEYRNNEGKKVAYGDGETFKVWSNKERMFKTITTDSTPDIMEMVTKAFPSQKGWQVTLELNVVLPQLSRVYGVWTFITKGAASSIPHIRDTFDALSEKNGFIHGVLCDLSVEFAKADNPSGSRFPVVSLIPNESQSNVEKVKASQEASKLIQ